MKNKFIPHGMSIIAREKGYNKLYCTCGGFPECICDSKTCEILWHDLIDWIFDDLSNTNIGKKLMCQNGWLEFWYKLLYDCPLSYEFKGRLLEWFRENKYYIDVMSYWDDESENIVFYCYSIQNNTDNWIYKEDISTYKEAEHQGILEIFKLIKKH